MKRVHHKDQMSDDDLDQYKFRYVINHFIFREETDISNRILIVQQLHPMTFQALLKRQ